MDNNRVSILLVADDRKFLGDVDRAGLRGGDMASKGLISRLQTNVAREMQRWELPRAKAIGEKAGQDIGIRIAGKEKEILTRDPFKGDKPFVERNPYYEYKKRLPRKTAPLIATPDEVSSREIRDPRNPLKELRSNEKVKKTPKTEKRPTIKDIRRENRKDNSVTDSNFENLGPFAPLPVKTKPDKKGKIKDALLDGFGLSVPTVKPIDGKKTKKGKQNVDPFNLYPGKGDPALDEAIKEKAKADRQAQQRRENEQKAQNRETAASQKVRQEGLEGVALEQGDNSLKFRAKRQEVNDRFDNKKTENLQTIQRLKFERQQKLDLGGDVGAGVDYTNQIRSIEAVMVKNEELRKSELRVLEVQQRQAQVINRRKLDDQAQANTRERRDEKLKESNTQKITELEGQKVGLTDKVAIARISQEIQLVKDEFRKNKEVNNIKDGLNDLNTNKNRLAENRRLGIRDPKLEAINFEQERNALVTRKRSTESNFQQQKASAEGTFNQTVDSQNLKTEKQVQAEITRLEALTNKSKAIGLSPTEKVKLELEVDRAKITAEFDKVKSDAQSVYDGLLQRQNALATAGIVSPALNKLLADAQKVITEAQKGKESALSNLANTALLKVAVAESLVYKQDSQAAKLVLTPGIEAKKRESKELIDSEKFREAAVPGKAAALDAERLRYNEQKSNFNFNIARSRAEGVVIPQDKVDQANAAIDSLYKINIAGITVKFDDLARSISGSNSELQKLARTETAGFLTQLAIGAKSFDDIWKKTVENVINGLIKIAAQKITDKLFDGEGKKGSNAGIAGAAINFIGGFLGFDDGGLIPGGQGHSILGSGKGPLAEAIRKEGVGATVVVGKAGERVLNLQETSAYQRMYPNGILNLDRGGIIGGRANGASSTIAGGIGIGSLLNGKFDVDLRSDGQSETSINNGFGEKVTQMMKGLIIEETRPGGILSRFS